MTPRSVFAVLAVLAVVAIFVGWLAVWPALGAAVVLAVLALLVP